MSDDKQHDQQQHDENLEAGLSKVSIPKWAGAYVGPYLKWPIIAFSGGLIFYMVCAGIKMVIK